MPNVRKPSNDPPDTASALAALEEASVAADRLTTLGLWSTDDDAHGINAAGLQTLADLLAVVTVQCAVAGTTHAERVMHATGRAGLAVLGNLTDVLSGVEVSAEANRATIGLLDGAGRTARGGGL